MLCSGNNLLLWSCFSLYNFVVSGVGSHGSSLSLVSGHQLTIHSDSQHRVSKISSVSPTVLGRITIITLLITPIIRSQTPPM